MSWLRTAVNRAVEVGGKNHLTRTVRSYADSVVQQAGSAVAGGARLLQDRIAARNMQNFRVTVKRLEEVSVSCRGVERVQVYYFDPQLGEPMNFLEVFLYSQALEGMTLSMILEPPTEEEALLFLEIFRICLAGTKEVHETVMSCIKNLAVAFSNYQEEVLVKREELLQYAQAAIAGLKINADLARIDAEACSLKEKLGEMDALQIPSSEGHEESSEKQTAQTVEALKEALGKIAVYSRLESLLLKKRSLSNGDSPQLHAEKVDKLKVLSESLANSTSKAEKRILEQRYQKEEALSFRVAKTNEVSQVEQDLTEGIIDLEKQKDELETELIKVNALLTAARARLRNAREEREQFDEASNQILLHLKSREEEISKSIAQCRVEADVVNVWVRFLENTWAMQTSYKEQKDKQVNGELERYGDYFVNLIIHLLSAYKEQLGPSLTRIKQLVEKLGSSERYIALAAKDDDSEKGLDQRRVLEEEYLNHETKLVTTLSVVDSMKLQFFAPKEGIHRKNVQRVKELFDELQSIKEEFDSIKRPILEIEIAPGQKTQSPSSEKPQISPWSRLKSASFKAEQKKPKYEFENDSEISEYETQEIVEWEYDAFEKDLKHDH
ncbi:hypothetical protein CCACVL1_17649 [Corchorus capsularis]|uniref:Uncharacterized protein n=1 Tax=Corchorus capsularis TaxID=210143 RepID=A0A1R3HQL6_COCAP|nr:hypothetical protein CCACVL1_17649 [Corchorus capsularis]